MHSSAFTLPHSQPEIWPGNEAQSCHIPLSAMDNFPLIHTCTRWNHYRNCSQIHVCSLIFLATRHVMREGRGIAVASFPGRSHLQYLIACSMQIWRGKAWEIWSRAVTSGRQMVDTRRAMPDSSNSRFESNRPWRCERRMVLTLPC